VLYQLSREYSLSQSLSLANARVMLPAFSPAKPPTIVPNLPTGFMLVSPSRDTARAPDDSEQTLRPLTDNPLSSRQSHVLGHPGVR